MTSASPGVFGETSNTHTSLVLPSSFPCNIRLRSGRQVIWHCWWHLGIFSGVWICLLYHKKGCMISDGVIRAFLREKGKRRNFVLLRLCHRRPLCVGIYHAQTRTRQSSKSSNLFLCICDTCLISSTWVSSSISTRIAASRVYDDTLLRVTSNQLTPPKNSPSVASNDPSFVAHSS